MCEVSAIVQRLVHFDFQNQISVWFLLICRSAKCNLLILIYYFGVKRLVYEIHTNKILISTHYYL